MTKDSAEAETTTLVVASEETPLLQANSEVLRTHPELEDHNATNTDGQTNGHDHSNGGGSNDEDDKPLPKGQVIALCYCRIVEPIAFFSIFPYINKMIEDTGGVEESDVGFYSGMIESQFSLTMMIMMVLWGRASDHYGRKPVLVVSLTGVGIFTAMFGLSQKIWQMVLFRCLAGVFSGTVVTLRAMISEHSTPKNQARAFSFFAFASNLGIFFGPMIGGALADPAKQYGGYFARHAFYTTYPYALPSIVAGAIGISAALLSAFFIQETLHVETSPSGKPATPPMSMWELIKAPGVANVVFLYNYILLLGMAYTAVAPVYWFTSPRLGGLGFAPIEISAFLAAGGLSQAIWLLFVFPPAQRRWGTAGVMRFCGILWPFFFAACPLSNYFLWKGWAPAFWTVYPIATVFGCGCAMAFTAVQLALNDISPSHTVLGTLNALAMATVCGVRAFAPAVFASIFAAGVKHQILGGYLVWVIFIVMGAAVPVLVNNLPEKAKGKVQKKRVDDDEGEGAAVA